MKRKILLLPLLAIGLTGCTVSTPASDGKGNNYHVHIQSGDLIQHFDAKDYSYGSSGTFYITLVDGTCMITGNMNAVIYTCDKCPLCGK